MRQGLLLLLAGCNAIVGVHDVSLALDGGGNDAPLGVADARPDAMPGPDAGPDATPSCASVTDVCGIVRTRYVGDGDSEMLVPTDVSSSTAIYAYVFDPGTMSFGSPIPGTGNTDGTFDIPNVPNGEYYLLVQPAGSSTVLRVETARYVDLTTSTIGRPNPETDSASAIAFNTIGKMTAWSPTDVLQVFCTNNTGYEYELEGSPYYDLSAQIATGAMSLTNNLTDPWGQQGDPLIHSLLGDKLDIWHQVSSTPQPGVTFVSLKDVFEDKSLDMSKGTTSAVNGSFTQVPQILSATLTFPTTKWAFADPSTAWPLLQPTNFAITITSLPGTTKYGQISGSDDVVDINFDPSITTDVDLGKFMYGDPFSTSLETVLASQAFWPAVVGDNGDPSQPWDFPLGGRAYRPYGASGSQDPIVSPVRNVKVNGNSLASNVYGLDASSNIEITWQAPAVGTPDSYRLDFIAVNVNVQGRWTSLAQIATFMTAGTQIDVPTGFLSKNQQYVLRVFASQGAGIPSGDSVYMSRAFRTGLQPAACGALGGACCTGGWNQCDPGGTCNGGLCVACGGVGQACCQTSNENACSSTGDACDYGVNPPSCEACGGAGQLCCDFDSCAGSGDCCVNYHCVTNGAMSGGQTCTNGSFGGCGANGQACCTPSVSGNTCTAPDTFCNSDPTPSCAPCGTRGELSCGGECFDGSGDDGSGTCN